MKHFLDYKNFSSFELKEILDLAHHYKECRKSANMVQNLKNKNIAIIFEKNSTRTRISFEAGINVMGGHAIILNSDNMQLGRGESISDTAKVMSRYVDMVVIRANSHKMIEEFAANSSVPVVNALTDYFHPCQIMADVMTFEEHRGSIKGKKVVWIGDCNNVFNSFVEIAIKLEFNLHYSAPVNYKPQNFVNNWIAQNIKENTEIKYFENPCDAVKNADLVVTDTWVSMGDKDHDARLQDFKNYQVTDKIMTFAKPNALFMHCLPAHRGEEVEISVIDGGQSVIFDEAENRMYVQQAIMKYLLDMK